MGGDERRTAATTGFATPPVDEQYLLVTPRPAGPGPIVPDRGSVRRYRLLEHVAYAVIEASEFRQGKAIGLTGGVDPSTKERFIGINISHPRDSSLVHQRFLGGLTCSTQPLHETIDVEILGERFRTDASSIGVPPAGVQEFDRAQPPDVAVDETRGVAQASGEHCIPALRRGERAIIH
jgi:hypothetical protein